MGRLDLRVGGAGFSLKAEYCLDTLQTSFDDLHGPRAGKQWLAVRP